MLTELSASKVYPRLFFEGVFASTTLRFWQGAHDLSWNSQTWLGSNGYLMQISNIRDEASIKANGASVVLAGMPSEILSVVFNQFKQGAPGKIWLGFLDSSGSLIADPILRFQGRLDQVEIERTPEESVIAITYESELIDLERPRRIRLTHQDQQSRFPGDKGFEFVESLQDKVIFWGLPRDIGNG